MRSNEWVEVRVHGGEEVISMERHEAVEFAAGVVVVENTRVVGALGEVVLEGDVCDTVYDELLPEVGGLFKAVEAAVQF